MHELARSARSGSGPFATAPFGNRPMELALPLVHGPMGFFLEGRSDPPSDEGQRAAGLRGHGERSICDGDRRSKPAGPFVEALVKGLACDCDGVTAVSGEPLRYGVGRFGLKKEIITSNPADPLATGPCFSGTLPNTPSPAPCFCGVRRVPRNRGDMSTP